jgi:serine/threonine protein kinase
MERGRAMSEMSRYNLKELLSQLRLLHEFHIVHLDVKPENVVWSENYKKAVFIDFGFSDIIQ